MNFWKINNEFLRLEHDPPSALRDQAGNLITSPLALKQLYLTTYIDRLSPAFMKKNYLDIFDLKKQLWTRRYENMKNIRTQPWNLENLDASLKRLKSNKSRDPHGMIGELFKDGYIGKDLKNALLLLFNDIKYYFHIPQYMTLSNITSISKKKGSKLDMDNQRGIFSLTIFKKVVDYLLFEDLHEEVDIGMGESNIWGQKRKNGQG